jgi:hypothetical protein
VSKESAAWLVVRTIGLVLVGEACFLLYGVGAQAFALIKLEQIDGALTSAADREALRVWVDVAITTAQVLIIGLVAFYFLRKGKAVHRMLMREWP